METPWNMGKKYLRKKRNEVLKKGALVAAGVGAGALAVSCGVAQAMSDLGTNRRMPAYGKLLNVTGDKPDKNFSAKRSQTAEALKEAEQETVHIRSFDGLTLTGHLVKAQSPKRLIVAVHGWRSTWNRDFCMVAPFWQEAGCDVLYVEQRAHGESQGKYIGFGLLERKDCLAWSRWAAEQYPDLPIYLSGISMGATTVLMAAGEDLPKNVKGIQADCGFTSPKEIWKHVAQNNLHMAFSPVRQTWMDGTFRLKLHQGLGSYSTVTAMQNCHVPVLFIHGTEDSFVPIEMTYENYLACTAPHRLLVIPGAGHGMSYAKEPKTCQRTMEEFWAAYDHT